MGGAVRKVVRGTTALATGGLSEVARSNQKSGQQAQAAQMEAQRQERLQLFKKQQEAMEKGMAEGETKAKSMTADLDYKNLAKEELERKKAARDKGLTAEQFTETQRRFRTSSRALRGAMAGQGVRGGTAAQSMASAYGQMQVENAALDAAVRQRNEENYNQAWRRQQGLRLSLPLAYGRLRGGQAAGMAQMAMANQATPQQQPGLLGQVFGGLF